MILLTQFEQKTAILFLYSECYVVRLKRHRFGTISTDDVTVAVQIVLTPLAVSFLYVMISASPGCLTQFKGGP